MITKDEIVRRLKMLGRNPHRSGRGWIVLCPAHNDRRPSLSITSGDDGNPHLHCFAGCSFDAIVAALGLDGKRGKRD